MTLDQLRIFVAVAERQHLTQAAAGLALTPSAVSSAIKALEERYETPLFHRVGRRIELSDAGRIFLQEARRALASARAAEATLAELGALRRGTLTIHASQTISSYWLPPLLVRFRLAHPGIELELVINNTQHVAEAVLQGSADVLAAVVEACRRGPFAARVDEIMDQDAGPEAMTARRPGELFSVLPTA
jgi:DNA-binding transcriptional LysR family regulator